MTKDEANAYLLERATNEGISFDDLMNMIPDVVSDDPTQAAEFCQLRDYSHIVAISEAPSLASDPSNAFFEHPSPNRSRGAEEATPQEIAHAQRDAEILAQHIDADTTGSYIYEPHQPVEETSYDWVLDMFAIPFPA